MLKKNSAPVGEQVQVINLLRPGQINVTDKIAKFVVEKTPSEIAAIILKEREARKRALVLSEIDDITELLLNRRGWRRHTNSLALKLAKKNQPFALFFIDLDRLKAVDDTFTNLHGTVYIQLFAQVLDETLRKKDIKSHPQGDEFFVMLPNVTKKEAEELRDAVNKNFEKKLESLAPDHLFYNVPKTVDVGASIGIGYKEWTEEERTDLQNATKSEALKKVKIIVRAVRDVANAESSKVKKKKRVIRDQAKAKKSRVAVLSSKFHFLKSTTILI